MTFKCLAALAAAEHTRRKQNAERQLRGLYYESLDYICARL